MQARFRRYFFSLYVKKQIEALLWLCTSVIMRRTMAYITMTAATYIRISIMENGARELTAPIT